MILMLNPRVSVYGRTSVSSRSFFVALVLVICAAIAPAGEIFAQTYQSRQQAVLLEPGKPIEGKIKGRETHSYHLTLTAGLCISLVVEQLGIDIALSLTGNDVSIRSFNSSAQSRGEESLLIIAESPGVYNLDISCPYNSQNAGRYELKLEYMRQATEEDKIRFEAEKAFIEGEQLRLQGTNEALREAVKKYLYAGSLYRSVKDQKREARSIGQAGFVLSSLGDKKQGVEYFHQELLIRQEIGDRKREGETLYKLGWYYMTSGDLPKAIEYYTQALEASKSANDRLGQADAINNIGFVHYSTGARQKALELYNQALSIFQYEGERVSESQVLNNIGALYHSIGDTGKARDYLTQALKLRKEIGDMRGEAETLGNLGAVYSLLGDAKDALEQYRQVLSIRRSLGDRAAEAEMLNNIATVLFRMGDTQTAIEHYNSALKILREVGDIRKEANTLGNLAFVHSTLGNVQTAFEYYSFTLKIAQSLKDKATERNVLNNIGSLFLSIGENERALDYYQQSLSIAESINDKRGAAQVLNNIASVRKVAGQKKEALEIYQKSLILFQSIGDASGESGLLNNIGSVYYSLGNGQAALEHCQKALEISRRIENRPREAEILYNIGSAYERLGMLDKAGETFETVLSLRRATLNRSGEAVTLYRLAHLKREQGYSQEALALIETAIKAVEDMRTKIDARELRASYFATVQDYYQLNIDLLMQLHKQQPAEGFDSRAFQVSERARSRSFLESLADSGGEITQGVDPELLKKERQIRQLINGKGERQVRLLTAKHTEEQKAEAERERRELVTEYQQLRARIRTQSPRYDALTDPQPFSLEDIQKQILAPSTLLLAYSLGQPRSYVWVISQTSISSFELPPRAEFQKTAEEVYSSLSVKNARPEKYTAALSRLSRLTVRPVAHLLSDKRLLIASDGALQYIPFGALPDPRNPSAPLVVKNEIVYLPSASTLALLRRETREQSPAKGLVAIVADPVFDHEDPRIKPREIKQKSEEKMASPNASLEKESAFPTRSAQALRSLLNERDGLARLPFTRREAEEIVALTPDGTSRVYLDFESSRETVTNQTLSAYRYIHLATHGWLDSESPELSGLVFSLFDREGNALSGFLGLADIYNLSLPAEMVVLSACQTAIGKEIRGEGLVSLTRGFMYAGSKRVVASLWKVEDFGTSELMRLMYHRILKEGASPASALRHAQLEMWKRKQPLHIWAAFVIQGEWN